MRGGGLWDEVALVVLDGLAGVGGGEEVGEGVGEAFLRGGDRRPHRGAEEPDVGGAGSVGSYADAGVGVGAACVFVQLPAFGVEEGAEFGELLEEVVLRWSVAVAFEGVGF